MTFDIISNITSQMNTWYALQIFGNNISIGGAQLNVSGLITGNVLQYNGAYWVNVSISTLLNQATTIMITPTAVVVPAVTIKMMGFGADAAHPVVFTPKNTGIILVSMSAAVEDSVTAGYVQYQLAYGTGSAPATAAAATGTTVGVAMGAYSGSNSGVGDFGNACFTLLITGLTANTQYWFDLQALYAISNITIAPVFVFQELQY